MMMRKFRVKIGGIVTGLKRSAVKFRGTISSSDLYNEKKKIIKKTF